MRSGEPDRIRTCDPLIKSQLLYQLSYGPITGRLFMNLVRGGQEQKRAALAKSPDGGYMPPYERRARLCQPGLREDARGGQ